ncbi:CBS domain-containing protein [Planotetraspora mira]|jgi:CBS domain-containing protein|nr:CBS domain-containing protein [Planotetraspora mira]
MTVETMTAADVMSRMLVTVEPDESPLMAWELMRRADLHHLPVIDAESRIVGVLRREDLACHWSGGPAEQSSVRVARLLDTQPCPCATPEMPLSAVAALMIDSDVDVVPVTGPAGTLEGLITALDVLKAVAGRATPPHGPMDVRGGLFRLEPVLPPC